MICNIRNILRVLPDGSCSLCGIGYKIPELIFGHAKQDQQEAVWKNTAIQGRDFSRKSDDNEQNTKK